MDAEERKKNILECSKKLFSKYGYYNTQISDIIKEANIARGTVYQYFKNKDAIFMTLLGDFYKDWETTIRKAREGIDLETITPLDYFRNRIKTTFLFFKKDHELCNIVLRVGLGLSGDFDSQIRRFEKKTTDLAIEDIKFGIRNKVISKDINIELAANLIGGALLRISYYYFVKKKNQKGQMSIDEMTDQIIVLIASGLFIAK